VFHPSIILDFKQFPFPIYQKSLGLFCRLES
jgi:hypothetical protein